MNLLHLDIVKEDEMMQIIKEKEKQGYFLEVDPRTKKVFITRIFNGEVTFGDYTNMQAAIDFVMQDLKVGGRNIGL